MVKMADLCKWKISYCFKIKPIKYFSSKETHQLAQANDEKNRKLREAFGIGEFDKKKAAEKKAEEAKEAERRKAELAKKQYT